MTGAMGTWHEQGLPRAELFPLRTLRKATGNSGVSAGNAQSLSLWRIAGMVVHKFHPVKLRLLQRDGPPAQGAAPDGVSWSISLGQCKLLILSTLTSTFQPKISFPLHLPLKLKWKGYPLYPLAREFPAKTDGLWERISTVRPENSQPRQMDSGMPSGQF